jgi:hypothetical protein
MLNTGNMLEQHEESLGIVLAQFYNCREKGVSYATSYNSHRNRAEANRSPSPHYPRAL